MWRMARRRKMGQVTNPAVSSNVESLGVSRIIFVCSFPNFGAGGGPSGVLSTLSKEYENVEVKPEFAYEFLFRQPQTRIHGLLKSRIPVRIFRAPFVATLVSFEALSLWFRVWRVKGENLFIAHDVFAALRCLVLGKKYVLVYHGQGPISSEMASAGRNLGPIRRFFFRRLEASVFEGAIKVAFPSNGALEAYLNQIPPNGYHHSSLQRKSEIIWNGIRESDLDYLSREELYRQIRKIILERELGLREGDVSTDELRRTHPIILLTISSLTELKGVDQIPEFLAEQDSLPRNFLWILVGDGSMSGVIQSEIARLGLEANFRHIRQRLSREMILALMDHSTVYLMLHRTSIFDMATLEAMSKGLVPVLSPVGGNLEINLSQNVIFYGEGDVLADVDWAAMRVLNRQTFLNEFTARRMAVRYSAFCSDLLHLSSG